MADEENRVFPPNENEDVQIVLNEVISTLATATSGLDILVIHEDMDANQRDSFLRSKDWISRARENIRTVIQVLSNPSLFENEALQHSLIEALDYIDNASANPNIPPMNMIRPPNRRAPTKAEAMRQDGFRKARWSINLTHERVQPIVLRYIAHAALYHHE